MAETLENTEVYASQHPIPCYPASPAVIGFEGAVKGKIKGNHEG